METLIARSYVDFYYVAFDEQSLSGYSMNNLIVNTYAGTCREAVIMEKRRFCIMRLDILVYFGIDMQQCYSGLYQLPCQLQRTGCNFTGFTHKRYFIAVFNFYH